MKKRVVPSSRAQVYAKIPKPNSSPPFPSTFPDPFVPNPVLQSLPFRTLQHQTRALAIGSPGLLNPRRPLNPEVHESKHLDEGVVLG